MPRIVLEPEVAVQLASLPPRILSRVGELLTRLTKWPAVSGAKPLRGNLAGRFRLRTGDYRIQFYVVDNQVVVEQVGHRDGFYDDY